MPYRVTVQPGNRDFICQGQETILQAGLRSGMALRYRCDQGSCGECASRLLSGEIETNQYSDYCFTQAQKDQGFFLPCISVAKSDLVIEVVEYQDVKQIPLQEIEVQVKKIQYLNKHLLVLALRTPRTQLLRYFSGQSTYLILPNRQKQLLPIASCPCHGRVLELHVLNHGDTFSHYVFTQLKNHDQMQIKGPVSGFVLRKSNRPLVFIAQGIGFALAKSLIEHEMALENAKAIYLCRLLDQSDQNYLHNLCRSWVDAIDNFFYQTYVYEDIQDWITSSNQHDQWIDHLAKNVPIADADIYLSGTQDTVSHLHQVMKKLKIDSKRIVSQVI